MKSVFLLVSWKGNTILFSNKQEEKRMKVNIDRVKFNIDHICELTVISELKSRKKFGNQRRGSKYAVGTVKIG